VVQALLRPTTYPHPAEDIQLIETHSSWVVLAGVYAYKLRKPVDLGFLDFSTPERRVRDCAEEVRLNRRLSPDVYLGIVEVLERDGAYVLSGPGSGGEPAVQMR
jgi:aminoglycoside phosphotransferase family enzyme